MSQPPRQDNYTNTNTNPYERRQSHPALWAGAEQHASPIVMNTPQSVGTYSHATGRSASISYSSALPTQQDEFTLAPEERGEQYETIQHLQDQRVTGKADRDQELLRREFPDVDGSLVAALYSDAQGEMSQVREMLQAIE